METELGAERMMQAGQYGVRLLGVDPPEWAHSIVTNGSNGPLSVQIWPQGALEGQLLTNFFRKVVVIGLATTPNRKVEEARGMGIPPWGNLSSRIDKGHVGSDATQSKAACIDIRPRVDHCSRIRST